ncbi:protein REVEILLE 1-like [Actinidia eriantha]|uniref:protein REVEILLE 1-like n=1 Tax=Actinidia eriantha TaxID=165200 RepID=UPI00258DF8C2|nr:protein REVEILLE 1-like [Actinidia eriantha]
MWAPKLQSRLEATLKNTFLRFTAPSVIRHSDNGDASAVQPIEIPPPRPKRKPTHPYPRKLVAPLKTGSPVEEQQRRSASPNLSVSEQENQSSTSVLSAIGSETLSLTDKNTSNGCLSPISAGDGVNPGGFFLSEPNSSPNSSPEETGSLLEFKSPDSSAPAEQVSVNLELFPQDGAFVKEESSEVASIQSLKLFGKTMLVTDSQRLSLPSMETCKPLPSFTNDERPVPTPWNLMPTEFSNWNTEGPWNPAAFYYMRFPNENSKPGNGDSGPPLPCGAYYGGMPFPCLPLHYLVPTKATQPSVSGQTQNGEDQKEGSRTGSNTGSANASDMNWEVETHNCQLSSNEEKGQQSTNLVKPSENLSFSDQRAILDKCLKGFVPYKRCLAERDTSSTVTGAEREEQRIRLCL